MYVNIAHMFPWNVREKIIELGILYAHISKISLGAEIEFACVYNRDEGIVFKKFYTVDSFESLIRFVKKIFKFGPDTIDSIYDEMVKTFKNSFDKVLK